MDVDPKVNPLSSQQLENITIAWFLNAGKTTKEGD